jgi:hypothetical protein
MKKSILILLPISIFMISGCSSRSENPIPNDEIYGSRSEIHTKPYELKITPIVGSRQDDSKVIRDMGKILKVWIAPYKNKETFVSAHDNFVVAKEPDFVVGETVPQRNWKAMKTPVNNVPFMFRSADMDTELNQETIVKYNNNVYKQQNNPDEAVNKINKADTEFDNEIKKFIDGK